MIENKNQNNNVIAFHINENSIYQKCEKFIVGGLDYKGTLNQ